MQPFDEGTSLYVRFRGTTTGPHTRDRLLRMRDTGQLTALHQVSPDGVTWQSAAAVGLVPVGAAPGPARSSSVLPAESPEAQAGAGQQPSAAWYYLDESRNRQGPVSREQLAGLIQQGALGPRSLVWSESTRDWVAVEQSELAAALPASRPLPGAAPAPPGGPRPPQQGAVVLGYVCCALALVLCPLFGIVGFVLGIVHLANSRVGHGVAQLLLSVACTAGGLILAALFVTWVQNAG